MYNLGDGDYAYRIDAFDVVGNSTSYFTNSIKYKIVYENEEPEADITIEKKENGVPVAVITGCALMEVGVEEFFDATNSSDDGSIKSYHWDFGDGTFSDEMKAIKKYTVAGEYTVTLTITDDQDVKSEKTLLCVESFM